MTWKFVVQSVAARLRRLLTAPVLAAAVVAVLMAGCVPRYKITLTNGNLITTRGKPKFDTENNVYRFKDAQGNPGYVPAFRVKEIAPL